MRSPGLHKLQLSKAAIMWLAMLLCSFCSFSQTTNISGVVNSYYKVTEAIPGADSIRLTNTFGINPGDRVLIIQMKGASINTSSSTSAAFGDTTALNNAGNYEVATICAVRDDYVYLVHDLLNNYSPSTGKVQLVKFGEYVNATVTDTLRASPWSDFIGTGGVIALHVEGDLTLNRPITANQNGFTGGAYFMSSITCTNFLSAYAYTATMAPGGTQNGAFKGECVADVPVGQNGGRGAVANGGGGGNNHNNGGGGGSNLVNGGLGGGNYSSTGCTANFRGIGGKALSSWTGRKIFLGGGGGAGHNNNGVLIEPVISRGGNGGGIIIIHADRIIGNGHMISANGETGSPAQADGSGGGGGAGTIIMDVITSYENVTIQANGGAGGYSNDGGNIRRCYGAGGGGSGGAIYFNGSNPSGAGVNVLVNGGSGGVKSGSDAACNAEVPGLAGTTGVIVTGYTYRRSMVLAEYCSTVLPVRLTFFKATIVEKKVTLQWNITHPEGVAAFEVQKMNTNNEWVSFASVTGNDLQKDYTITDVNTLPGYNSYRLKVIEKSNAVFYSLIRRVYIESENDQFTIYPNPARNKIFIKADYNGFIDIRLLDITGKSVLLKRSRLNILGEVDLPSLPAGVYVLHINNTVRKLVIQ